MTKSKRGQKPKPTFKDKAEIEKLQNRKTSRDEKIAANRPAMSGEQEGSMEDDMSDEETQTLEDTIKEQQHQLKLLQAQLEKERAKAGPSRGRDEIDDDDEPPPLPDDEELLRDLPPIRANARYAGTELKHLDHLATFLFRTNLKLNLGTIKIYCEQRNPKFLKYVTRDLSCYSSKVRELVLKKQYEAWRSNKK